MTLRKLITELIANADLLDSEVSVRVIRRDLEQSYIGESVAPVERVSGLDTLCICVEESKLVWKT